jgi:3D-(3,5/4)-trihydroxycyclohexane-1,2-dione acylhydrolase (decyclizing)
VRASTIAELESALYAARASSHTTVIHVETDPLAGAPSSEAWWDVPVAETSELDSTRAAREEYERNKRTQQTYLSTHERVETP